MGILDFLTGKSKSAPPPTGATDIAAASPDELKKEIAKYGLNASKIDVKVDGAKVTLSGSAPSTVDAEKICLAVRNTKGVMQVDNKISVDSAEPESIFYVVKSGDTLWKIAEMQYGKGQGAKYSTIFEANKPLLKDPNHIYPGQRLRIPSLGSAKSAGADIQWKSPSV